MGRWDFSTTQLGVLTLKTNKRTGKPLGVSKSGKKRAARVWCLRRQKQIHLGTFPDTPQAAVAIATAVAQGVGHVRTPKARKTRSDKKKGKRVARPPPLSCAPDC